MLLVVDVGNTNIVAGCIEGFDIKKIFRVSTDHLKTEYEYAVIFKNVFEFEDIKCDEFEGAIISSVVPPMTDIIKSAIKILTGLDSLVVGAGIKTGLNIKIDDPAQAGADLVVGAVAALSQYKPPIFILDMGTATTMFVIDKNSNFIGGMIYPGVGLSYDALSAKTSQLPNISFTPPKKCIGSNTIDSMKSGAIYGTASMIDGIIDRMEDELGEKASLIATGGLAKRIVPYCKHDIICDDNLLLTGLAIIYRKNVK